MQNLGPPEFKFVEVNLIRMLLRLDDTDSFFDNSTNWSSFSKSADKSGSEIFLLNHKSFLREQRENLIMTMKAKTLPAWVSSFRRLLASD